MEIHLSQRLYLYYEWLQGAQYIGIEWYQRYNKVYLTDIALSLDRS